MKKLIGKSLLYAVLLVVALELWVRVFHLSKDNPVRIVDDKKVEKWMPNQSGHSVTGNRRQNFSEYKINNAGFNSYREYSPSKDKIELALVGDSFIEGFHQHYYNSTGKKIEDKLPGIEVYEYGYAGYDMADQLHLIKANKEQFDLIDHVILGIKFSNDLDRGKYEVVQSRLRLESPLYRTLRKSKLLVYAQSIGAFDIPKKLINNILSIGKKKKERKEITKEEIRKKELGYIKNLESLISIYGFDKQRFVFLYDGRTTSPVFVEYLNNNNFKSIDFSSLFKESKRTTTLIYDMHWNNHGRELVATAIADYIKKNTPVDLRELKN